MDLRGLIVLMCLATALGASVGRVKHSLPKYVSPLAEFSWVLDIEIPGLASNDVIVSFIPQDGFQQFSDTGAEINGDQVLTYSTIQPPMREGIFSLVWQVSVDGVLATNPNITLPVEVSCTDGNFCNGHEKLINGQCVGSNLNPCDDGNSCTTDTCDSVSARCSYAPAAGDWSFTECPSCAELLNCVPDCTNKDCGDDGCGGICGTCDSNQFCTGGVCGTTFANGSCYNPYKLLADGEDLLGFHWVTGDTSQGVHVFTPSCNSASKAAEIFFEFTVDVNVGVDARVTSITGVNDDLDTVLEIRDANCQKINLPPLFCTDDAVPPGGLSSRVAVPLAPGTYKIMVDGYSEVDVGPFNLTTNFLIDCIPNCEGKYCGDDQCGGVCGQCGAEEICDFGRCVSADCTADCTDKQCGSDGCGGSCGECAPGELCLDLDNSCQVFPVCNHYQPECTPACGTNSYCGSDCQCYAIDDPLPDFFVNVEAAATEVIIGTRNFTEYSCTIVEGCIQSPGEHKILAFTVEVVNQGHVGFSPPPPETRPDLFTYSSCHGHYHFLDFATWSLLTLDGTVVVNGFKQAYCMEDSSQFFQRPDISCEASSDCDNQGIQPGWSDRYDFVLDCQWIELNSVPDGQYILSITTNFGRTIHESTFENNNGKVLFQITGFNVTALSTDQGYINGILDSHNAITTGIETVTTAVETVITDVETVTTGSDASSTGNSDAADSGVFLQPTFLGVFFSLLLVLFHHFSC